MADVPSNADRPAAEGLQPAGRADGELLCAYAETRSEPALREIVDRYGALVYGVCLRILGDRAEAEDAAQVTLILFCRRAPAISRSAILPGWLAKAARTTALNARRRILARRSREIEAARRKTMSAPYDPVAEPGAIGCLDEALGSLPAKYHDAVVLRYLAGLSEAQTAASLGCTPNTAKARVRRGIEKLRRALGRRGYALAPVAVAGMLQPAEAALPAGLAARLVAGCTGQVALSSSVAGAVEAVEAMLFWAKVKVAASVAAGALLAGAVAGVAVYRASAAGQAAEPARTAMAGSSAGDREAAGAEAPPPAGPEPVTAGVPPAVSNPPAPAAIDLERDLREDRIFQHRMLVDTDKKTGALGLRKDPQPAPLVDERAGVLAGDRDPTDLAARRTDALLDHLAKTHPERPGWTSFRKRLDPLLAEAKAGRPDLVGKDTARQKTFLALCALRREIALANPLLDFEDLLLSEESDAGNLLCRTTTGHWNGATYSGYHWIEPGGRILLLRGWKTSSPVVTDLCEDATVENGPYKGQRLQGGTFHAPSLSFDGKTVFFSWAKLNYKHAEPDGRQRMADSLAIFRIGVDGKGLRQLTYGGPQKDLNGPHNDTEPCELPDGRIAFMSTRREVYDRCKSPRPAFTLCSMKPDGTDILQLSYHETHEWMPSVGHDGMILYSRWDYVDRSTVASHGIWTCYPDGRDPRAPGGNYTKDVFRADDPFYSQFNPKGRTERQPLAVLHVHAIPGSKKVMGIASHHHSAELGAVVVLDLERPDDYAGSQVFSMTPGPWGGDSSLYSYWCSPYPLSEDFFLANYCDRIYLADRFGNWELVYHMRDALERNIERMRKGGGKYWNAANVPAPDANGFLNPMRVYRACFQGVGWRPLYPRPVRARPRPPAIPAQTYQSEDRRGKPGHQPATIAIANVYDTDIPLPKGVKIERLRLVQVLGDSSGQYGSGQYAPLLVQQSAVKLPLGTVPVEKDGSVHCLAPIGKGFYFQLLDGNGLAVHSMKSVTYVHPGERLSCRGCHEPYHQAAPRSGAMPLAFRRAPSPLTQETPDGKLRQIDDYIRPAVDRVFAGCVACHESKKEGPRGPAVAAAVRPAPDKWLYVGHPAIRAFDEAMDAGKKGRAFAGEWIWHVGVNPINSGPSSLGRTTPDRFGARGSKVWEHLQKNRQEIKGLQPDDIRLFALWLDLLCVTSSNYGPIYTVKDAAGNTWPRHPDLDLNNPLGLEVVPRADNRQAMNQMRVKQPPAGDSQWEGDRGRLRSP